MYVYYPRADVEAGRVSTVANTNHNNATFETLCNWSYAKEKHFSREALIQIIETYDANYNFLYRCIFNEIPQSAFKTFLKETHASTKGIKQAYRYFARNKKNVRAFSI